MASNEGSGDKQRWTDSKVYIRKSFKGLKSSKTSNVSQKTLNLASQDGNPSQQQLIGRFDAASDDSSSLNRPLAMALSSRNGPKVNGLVRQGISRQENRVIISLSSRSKHEMQEIRKKLKNELDLIRNLVKKIEAEEVKISGGANRVHSEVGSVGHTRESRPLNQLSISVLENSQGGSDNVEKEKRTPKANQFYRKSEFLLGKDKFPPSESNKKSKSNGKKQGMGELGHGFGLGKFSNQIFKSCSALLEKLMKHKHGWVFNNPVDVKNLGLHDYFDIIKHPMDFGTVKSRLDKNFYKSPKEFAEDVRLTFSNAMTYNGKGQDVYIMAEQLLKIFEDKWAIIEADYMRELRLAMDYEASLPTPTSKMAPPNMRRILDRSESITHSVDPKPKAMSFTGRTPAPKKPKAKDRDKRDMTYEEKQKLSANLQSLPSEKLDNIVQIIKKRNSSLCQQDDEIEVDIDNVDTETLWELDRFVTNYKKSLSKNKRKAEVDAQVRAGPDEIVQQPNPVPSAVEMPKETRTDENNAASSSPVQGKKKGDKESKSSSLSSSSSDSGSSSSGSGSESSSENGSDSGHSPHN